MNVADLLVRIAIFAAIVGPGGWLVVRQVRKAQSMPFDRNLDRQSEMARGWGSMGDPPGPGGI
ncbi:MAG: hypothetical protein ACXIVQ_08415 [Acidimicrobiales bacterium]